MANPMKMRARLLAFLIFASGTAVLAQDIRYETKLNVPYYFQKTSQTDEYMRERCVMDIYYPKNKTGFATIVWFHGGGLKAGNKEIPKALQEQGFCIVAPNYRFYPKIKSPAYIEDAAAAVAWVFRNINKYGGDTTLIFLSGHSAGGYLDMMVGLDKQWLQVHEINANRLAGLIPFSGHTITHMTVREESGIPETQPVVDAFAPLHHVRADAPPLLLITGDRELEMLGRYEENAYMVRMMKLAGHRDTRIYELEGYGHGMTAPAFPLLIKEVERITERRKK